MVKDSAWFGTVRDAAIHALGDVAHGGCFLSGLRSVWDCGYGRVALAYHDGEPVGASWIEIENKKPPEELRGLARGLIRNPRHFWCNDADLKGVDDLIFNGTEHGSLEVPEDASVHSRSTEVPSNASRKQVAVCMGVHKTEAVQWSERPGAWSALVLVIKDRRLVSVATYVGRERGPAKK